MANTLVLGMGNLVHGDDGIGVHAIQRLQQDSRVPPHVNLLDGGTHGLALLPHISGVERLLVIDAIDTGEPPGTLIRIEAAALEQLPGKPSVHQLGFADLMVALKLIGGLPKEVIVLGMQPQTTEWSAELSLPVSEALGKLIEVVINQLQTWERSTDSLTMPGENGIAESAG